MVELQIAPPGQSQDLGRPQYHGVGSLILKYEQHKLEFFDLIFSPECIPSVYLVPGVPLMSHHTAYQQYGAEHQLNKIAFSSLDNIYVILLEVPSWRY